MFRQLPQAVHGAEKTALSAGALWPSIPPVRVRVCASRLLISPAIRHVRVAFRNISINTCINTGVSTSERQVFISTQGGDVVQAYFRE